MIFTVSQAQTPIHLTQHHVTLHMYATDTVPVHNHRFIKFGCSNMWQRILQ